MNLAESIPPLVRLNAWARSPSNQAVIWFSNQEIDCMTDQEFLTAMRIRPDEDIPDKYGSAPACAPCASKDAWIEDVQEANRGMVKRLDRTKRLLFMACFVIGVLALELAHMLREIGAKH